VINGARSYVEPLPERLGTIALQCRAIVPIARNRSGMLRFHDEILPGCPQAHEFRDGKKAFEIGNRKKLLNFSKKVLDITPPPVKISRTRRPRRNRQG